MATTKRIQIDPAAIKDRLEKNKERAKGQKREKVSLEDNPIFKVPGEGEYLFRASHYPHSSDPVAEPFPTRHYHFGIPGDYVVYCPQENDGETCSICDFLWEQMRKHKGNKPKVKFYADKLPKARVWIPGKARGRESEGPKFLTVGTRKDKMSENHEKIFEWFFKKSTASWIDPVDGFDMILKYEKYDELRAKQLHAPFGLKTIDLERDSSEFGDDFDDFLDAIPNVDDSDDPTLKSYRKRTSKEAESVLQKWSNKLEGSTKRSDEIADADTGDEESGKESEETAVSEEDMPVDKSSKKGSIQERLKKLGVKL